MFTLHVLSLPHTQTTPEYSTCAYTQKAVKFCKMMKRQGHKVILYSGEQNTAECDEHVVCVTEAEREGWFGKHDLNDLDRGGFDWEPTSPWWRTFAGRAITRLSKEKVGGHFLCMTTSWPQKIIADAFPEMIAVESGVGYEGITDLPCAFESYAWMHHCYGLRGIRDGRPRDAVIPNYFDVDEFPHVNKGDGQYLLFVGRVTPRKGLSMAIDIARAVGIKLKVAGPATGRPQDVFMLPDDVDWVGPVTIDERSYLMAGARALICPTQYIEPFGGVSIEAMMSGTPVIATDWGAFSENIHDNTAKYEFSNGALIRTVDQGVQAVNRSYSSPDVIRRFAVDHFGLKAVGPQFEQWFSRLQMPA